MGFIDAQHYRQSLEEELNFHREAGNIDIVMGLEIAVAVLADEPIEDNVIILPCAEGSTIYKITKFCGRTKGYREEYKPFVEFERKCEFYERSLFYGEEDKCIAKIDDPYKEPWWCSYNLDILCETCKGRIAIQKDVFTLPKLKQIYNTPAFNPNTDPENIFYLTYEEAEAAMKKLIGEE